MPKFGWSYPPGCSDPPDDEYPDYPCVVCGKMPNDCTCPECPECGSQGCVEHMKTGDLANLIRTLDFRLTELNKEAKRRETLTSPYPICQKVQTIDIFREDPIWCCNQEYWSTGWREVYHGE